MSLRKPPPWLLSALVVLPLLVWWLGWTPGFASPDTVDQWRQAQSGVVSNHHPAIHTLYLDLFSLGTTHPELVTLFQLLVLSGLLAYATVRLTQAGVPPWLAVAAAWLLGFSPAIAPTTLALWKDVVFGLFLLWAWIELLDLGRSPTPARSALIRLAMALAGVWLFRGNGPITVVLLAVALAWPLRRHWKPVGWVLASMVVLVALVVGPLYSAARVRDGGIEVAQVFIPDLASVYVPLPTSFDESEQTMISALARRAVWTDSYDCYDSTPLLFHPEFDHDPIRQQPGPYLRLQLGAALDAPTKVIGHRACAASFIFVPAQPEGVYFHRPPYDMPENDLGLVRDPISSTAFDLTLPIWQWAEVDERLWLTWRPAIVVVPALLAGMVFAVAPRGRRFLLPWSLFAVHVVNVAATSPTQEFRFVYPLYLTALLTLTLLYPSLKVARD